MGFASKHLPIIKRYKRMTISSKDIDRNISVEVANSILNGIVDGTPAEMSLSILNGIVNAATFLAKEITNNAELSDVDGIEKLILSWLSATDPVTGLKFSKFISTDCIGDIDFNSL